MGFIDEVVFDVIWDGAQYFYFKIKNNKRAKTFAAYAAKNDLSFSAKIADYHGEIMEMHPPSSADLKAQGKKKLSRKARRASRWFGDSTFQTHLWAFVTNRYRGSFQSNFNIMEGTWKGHLMTTFDTLWFETFNGTDKEGEYSSIFAHCKGNLPQVVITPTGLISMFKRVEESQILNSGYHRQDFESTAFNKAWRVASVDSRLASDFISQNLMEYLLDHKNEKWHIELSPGGVLISTVYALSPAKVEQAMDFLAGFIEHVDEDLLASGG
ncbi:MAG: hypothetical protein CMJ24_12455 [Phycisphaerae bacterium]|nr:hypothetical protein [Phycisphaerae bacterium]MDG1898767.1 hypothetical protein [Phycisphaerales bacterium]|tara:strand:- start:1698 stop:2504 length:807 start_codon:yes stop_codon:yes gene_type:complete